MTEVVVRSLADDANQFLNAHSGSLDGRIPETAFGFDQLLREGFPWSVLSTINDVLDIDRKNIAALLQVSPSTLGRHFANQRPFMGAQADVVYRVLGTLGAAERVLKTSTNASSWLKRPQPGLDGAIPLDLLRTSPGAEAVNLLLDQMYGGIVP